MNKFEANQELQARSICDHNCIYTARVIKRTAKTVTIISRMKGEKRCKVYTDERGEYIFPFGQYSMAPIMRAQ